MGKLAEKSGRNDYLTSAWKGEAGGYYGDEAVKRHPQGVERERINNAFDALVQEIKTKETDEGVAMFSRKSPSEDSPAALGFDLVDKIAHSISIKLGFDGGGVRIHVEAAEESLPGKIVEQAEKEGALGEIIAVHLGKDIYLVDEFLTMAQGQKAYESLPQKVKRAVKESAASRSHYGWP
ncbi:MAG: hypothetical protein ABW148_17630 [Sedimenticola sp.]